MTISTGQYIGTIGSPPPPPEDRQSVIAWLDGRIMGLLGQIRENEFWKTVSDPSADPYLVQSIMREVYLEIVGYQPHVIEAAIAAVAQMPRSMDPRLVKSMLAHQGDEFDHGEMALRDFVGLGGSESEARAARMSPASFAAAGVWWMVVRSRDPFAYLGALYLFEGLTPKVTAALKGQLQSKGLSRDTLEYIEFHSTEDIKHANLVRHLISEISRLYPEAIDSIKYGYECFEFVYPVPVWASAFQRATQSFGAVGGANATG